LQLILGGAALQRCGNRFVLNLALEFAEKPVVRAALALSG
jgi:hypothetical protein